MGQTMISVDFQGPEAYRERRWYALFVRVNQEKRITPHLACRGIEYFLPVRRSVRQWKDRRVSLEVPIFPGYVFVHLPFEEGRAKALKVLTIPNVLRLVGTSKSPSAMSDEEIAWIRCALNHGGVEPHPYLTIGERVVITSGAMSGIEGILTETRSSARVVVALGSIARAFVVEIGAGCVEAVKSVNTGSREPAESAIAQRITQGTH